MSEPITRPKRKNPILQTRAPTLPPDRRSRVCARPRPRRGAGRVRAAMLCGTAAPCNIRRAKPACAASRTDCDGRDAGRARRTVSETTAAAFSQELLFPRTRAVAARAGPACRRRRPGRASRCALSARRRAACVVEAAARPRRPGRAGRACPRRRCRTRRRTEAARHDVRPEVPQSARHRRQNRRSARRSCAR